MKQLRVLKSSLASFTFRVDVIIRDCFRRIEVATAFLAPHGALKRILQICRRLGGVRKTFRSIYELKFSSLPSQTQRLQNSLVVRLLAGLSGKSTKSRIKFATLSIR